MTINEQLQAADTAIQATQFPAELTFVPMFVGLFLFVAASVVAFRCQALGRKRLFHVARGCAWAFAFAAMIGAGMAGSWQADANRALAQKEVACDAAISELIDTGRSDVAKAALKHDCSREKLLIAALSSGGLSPDLAKALISDHGDLGS